MTWCELPQWTRKSGRKPGLSVSDTPSAGSRPGPSMAVSELSWEQCRRHPSAELLVNVITVTITTAIK